MKAKGTAFVEHIETHLDEMDLETVICKICGKTVDEIWDEYKHRLAIEEMEKCKEANPP